MSSADSDMLSGEQESFDEIQQITMHPMVCEKSLYNLTGLQLNKFKVEIEYIFIFQFLLQLSVISGLLRFKYNSTQVHVFMYDSYKV